VIDMLLGIGEIVIIIIVTLALFLPELSKRRDKSSHKFKLYLIIALLVALVLILSRFIFKVMSIFGLLIFFVIIILYAIGKKFVE
jgi:hypothetical protein